MAIRTTLAALALLTALSACSDDTPQFAPDCPKVAILSDAADISRYRNPGPGPHDLTDLVLTGRITAVKGACEAGRRGLLNAGLSVSLTLSRGPAAPGRQADVGYFVAVTRGGEILDKQVFPLHVTFPSNTDRVALTGDEVSLKLPVTALSVGAGRNSVTGQSYTIWTGFELSPAEFAAAVAKARGSR